MPNDNTSWLIAEGGSCIRLRTLVELLGSTATAEITSARAQVLADPRVKELLHNLQVFDPNKPVTIEHFNALHSSKSSSLESAVGKLLELGLRRGDGEFDRLMERFLGYVNHPQIALALTTPQAEITVEGGRRIFFATVVASYLLRAGYAHTEVIQFVRQRLHRLRHVAEARIFDIHLNDQELERLPRKRPFHWLKVPVLIPKHNPTTGTQPLPLIHDLFALAYLPLESLTAEESTALSTIVEYVLTPQFQKLPVGYGLLWNEKERAYHGCGWSPHLARLDSSLVWQKALIVQQAELFSRFEAGVDSEWLKQVKGDLDSYHLPNGHYLFPRAYLQDKSMGYYVGGTLMGLESNRRIQKTYELESTFHWELISASIRNNQKAAHGVTTDAAESHSYAPNITPPNEE